MVKKIKQRETPDGLPVVTKGTIDSMKRDEETGSFNFLRTLKEMEVSNPELAKLMYAIADERHGEMVAFGIEIYELLTRQNWANQMKRQHPYLDRAWEVNEK